MSLGWLARCLAEIGEFDEGIATGREAIRLAEEIDRPYAIASASWGLGYLYGLRGDLDSGSYLACYVNDGRIDAAVGLNRAKDVRRVIPLIKSRRVVDLDQVRDEAVDLRSLHQP